MSNNWIPSEFNIFGCEYSTDIDLGILVPNPQIIIDYKNKKFNLDLSLISTDLELLGFDLNFTKLDINLIYIDPNTKNLSSCLIGSKDTQNIIYYTYNLHPQSYPIFFSNPVEIDMIDKVRFFSKLILDSIEELLGKNCYKELRPTKSKVYMDLSLRLDFSIKILNEVNFVDLFNINPDLTKSIGMKLAQMILLYNDDQAYTKKTISDKISNLVHIDSDSMFYILSRGKFGFVSNPGQIQNIFQILLNNYCQIINEVTQNLNFLQCDIDPNNIDTHNFLLCEFIKSPEKPTIHLSNWIDNLFSQTKSLNTIFELNSFGCENLPDVLIHHIHLENQRSSEWLELLKFYKCGNSINNQINYINCETNFNLVRGCLGEMLITNYVDWNKIVGFDVKKCICGLIVEKKGIKDSFGIAPDLLLIGYEQNYAKEKIVIPVEIKTLVSDPDIINRKFLREISLGSKQLDTSIQLINNTTGTKTYGLMVFCFIHNDKITIKYKKYTR
jgi:hypothetical protein